MLGAMYDNIGELYRDLFIETCDTWVIPYIGDLLGVSLLSGSPWTLRADVADTIALRRRKGTLHALELLAYDLTEWASFCLELRDTLAWHQHLNHQRPDVQSTVQQMEGIARGGTAAIRDPALLSLIGTPFDPFAYYADFKPLDVGVLRRNLPDVAVFLWRLVACQVGPSMPVWRGTTATGAALPQAAQAVALRYGARREPGRALQRFAAYAQSRRAHGFHYRPGAGADSHGAPYPGHACRSTRRTTSP